MSPFLFSLLFSSNVTGQLLNEGDPVPPVSLEFSAGVPYEPLENLFFAFSDSTAFAMKEFDMTELEASTKVFIEHFRKLAESGYSQEEFQNLNPFLQLLISKCAKVAADQLGVEATIQDGIAIATNIVGIAGTLVPADLIDIATNKPHLLFNGCRTCARHPEWLEDVDISYNLANEFLLSAVDEVRFIEGIDDQMEALELILQKSTKLANIDTLVLKEWIDYAGEDLWSQTVTTLSNHFKFEDGQTLNEIVISSLAEGLFRFLQGDITSIIEDIVASDGDVAAFLKYNVQKEHELYDDLEE